MASKEDVLNMLYEKLLDPNLSPREFNEVRRRITLLQ